MNRQNIFLSILMVLSILGCNKTEYNINSTDVVKLSEVIVFEHIGSASLIADSSSSTELVIALNKLADTAFLSVKLSTDLGFFSNGTRSIHVMANSNRKAICTLFTGEVQGTAHLRAIVNNIAIDTSVLFVKALPDYIQLKPVVMVTDRKDIRLGLKLGRNIGKTGQNIWIKLKYVSLDTLGALLDIPPFMVVESEIDSIPISNPLDLKGQFRITAQVQNQMMDTISTSAVVVFQ